MNRLMRIGIAALSITASASGQSFVNFETPQVHPIELTPDGQTLLVVNTADNRLEVFSLTSGLPKRVTSIQVGLEPVSVRARSNTEAWVVNQVSDSVSVVDLPTARVAATLAVGDEPADVVFAGAPQRAFVSVSQENVLRVYDPASLATAPTVVPVQGEDPRALASDGARVFAAIFDSGNRTSVIPQSVVSGALNPYPGQPNPPPNLGLGFDPPIDPGLPAPPPAALIVERVGTDWMDDNLGLWTPAIPWNLHDHDVAVIDSATLAVTYATGLMNANMGLATGPGGRVYVVGTDATNVVRFEPNVRGTFVRVKLASFDPATLLPAAVGDLNPHLSYATQSIPQPQRNESIGDPRAIAFLASGAKGYVAGMGSNNVIVIDSSGARLNRIDVGQGPTGLKIDEPRGQMYVLNRFDASISTISTGSDTEVSRVSFFDPTPQGIRDGRPFLYDTHLTSGLGQASCASCHIDGRMDQLAWDLGDPLGAVKPLNQPCQAPFPGACNDWHPMKGPMMTQTLFGLQGVGGLHWRADREDLAAFNPAFVSLLGADAQLTSDQMNKFNAFVNTLSFPPNPNRTLQNGLRSNLNGANAQAGSNIFINNPTDGPLTCQACHALPAGTNGQLTPGMALLKGQAIKIPHLRNMYEKTGFDKASQASNRGFGFSSDGTFANLVEFLSSPVFTGFAAGAAGQQQRRDVEAFMLSFATPTHAAIGSQSTLVDLASATTAQVNLLNTYLNLGNGTQVGLVAKSRQGGISRGYRYNGANLWQSDRQSETLTDATLRALAAPGAEVTYTIVPLGNQTRIGIDRDLDSFLDRDELDARSNPADPASTPQPLCVGNADGDAAVSFADITAVLVNFGADYGELTGPGDANRDGVVDFADITAVLVNFGQAC